MADGKLGNLFEGAGLAGSAIGGADGAHIRTSFDGSNLFGAERAFDMDGARAAAEVPILLSTPFGGDDERW